MSLKSCCELSGMSPIGHGVHWNMNIWGCAVFAHFRFEVTQNSFLSISDKKYTLHVRRPTLEREKDFFSFYSSEIEAPLKGLKGDNFKHFFFLKKNLKRKRNFFLKFFNFFFFWVSVFSCFKESWSNQHVLVVCCRAVEVWKLFQSLLTAKLQDFSSLPTLCFPQCS